MFESQWAEARNQHKYALLRHMCLILCTCTRKSSVLWHILCGAQETNINVYKWFHICVYVAIVVDHKTIVFRIELKHGIHLSYTSMTHHLWFIKYECVVNKYPKTLKIDVVIYEIKCIFMKHPERIIKLRDKYSQIFSSITHWLSMKTMVVDHKMIVFRNDVNPEIHLNLHFDDTSYVDHN